uniref:RRM domain-containing protein n=1 Tax=Syphacia muris TaxID=451379 RepID=A0A158R3W7_9BILA
MSRRNEVLECKVYVGGLPNDATSQELEDAFHRFGRIRKVWVARRPPGFAFIEFEDSRDAEDAVRALDGTRICGVRARVELSHGRRRGGGGGGDYGGYRGARYSRELRRRSFTVQLLFSVYVCLLHACTHAREGLCVSPSRSPRRSRSRSPIRGSPTYDDRKRSASRSVSPQRSASADARSRSASPANSDRS